MPDRRALLIFAAAIAVAIAVVAVLDGRRLIGPGGLLPGAAPTFAVASAHPETSPCTTSPDPANGGRPAVPAEALEGQPPNADDIVAMKVVALGDLVLPSDTLLVGDLFALHSFFLDDLPRVGLKGFTGAAPVCVHVAEFADDARVAFAHVRLGGTPVQRWVPDAGGFGVDGGLGGFASVEAIRATAGRDAGADLDAYLHAVEATSVETWSWANITIDTRTGANVIGFSTGYGDGGYPVYAGIDAEGRVVSIVVDLFVVPWSWLDRAGPVR